MERGFDKRWQGSTARSQLFVIFLTRLLFILEHGFIDHLCGLIIDEVAAREGLYHRVGFVDGCRLQKVYTRARRLVMKWGRSRHVEDYGTARFPRSLRNGDLHEEKRFNVLVYDPVKLETRHIVLV